MGLTILQNIWFILIGVLLIGYSILDGFDLGVASLLPILAKTEKEKRILFNSIGPFWDGNEVWLLTGGGALFAAFPHVYATVFSGFYLALMLVLFCLIFRAVSLEFRAHYNGGKTFWEWAFVIGSLIPSLLYGVALGNVVQGIPLDKNMEFTGTFFTLLRPFPLVIGLLGLVMILIQGATYTMTKTDGELRKRAVDVAKKLWIVFWVLFVLSIILSFIVIPNSIKRVTAWLATILIIIDMIFLRNSLNKDDAGQAFIYSSIVFVLLWAIAGSVLYPNLVRATNPDLSLTISNASSSQLTLTVMLIIALIGMPFVIGYTIYVYKIFKGKIVIEEK